MTTRGADWDALVGFMAATMAAGREPKVTACRAVALRLTVSDGIDEQTFVIGCDIFVAAELLEGLISRDDLG